MNKTPLNNCIAQSDIDLDGFGIVNAPIKQNAQNGAYEFVLSDSGKHVLHDSADPHDWTIPANASVAFPIGTAITIVNATGAGVITLKITNDTLSTGNGVPGVGDRSISADSIATILKIKLTEWKIGGTFT